MIRQVRSLVTSCAARWVVLLGAAAAAGADALRPVSPEDILNVRWAVELALSPDGSRIAYVVMEPAAVGDSSSRPLSNLWMSATAKGSEPRPAALGHSDVHHPEWSPDGKCLTFLSKGEGSAKSMQIWLLRLEGQLPTCLTHTPKGIVDYRWSPGSSEIAFTTPESVDDEHDPIEVDRRHRRNRLWIARLSDATARAVTGPDRHVVEMAWSPNTKEIAAVAAPDDTHNAVVEKAALVIVDAKTGSLARTLSTNAGDRKGLAWSPDGKALSFIDFAPKHFAHRLALVSAAGGRCLHPLDDFRATPETGFSAVRWLSDSRHLLVPVFEATHCRLLRVDTEDGTIERLAPSVRNFWSYSASADGETIAMGAENGHSPPDVVVLKTGQEPVKLTDLNPQLSAVRLGDVSEVSWKNTRDGRTVYGVLITPPDFVRGVPLPMVVQLHGGPQDSWWDGRIGTWLSWGQLLASHGYVVFLPNPRGSIGQGWQFSEAVHRDWGGMDFQDVMDGVDSLVKQRVAAPDRLSVGGWSYGGFLTASATTQTDRFKAAVVGACNADLETHGLTTDLTAWFQHMMGPTSVIRDETLARLSPLKHIDRCRTPTLVLHGEKDERCPVYHGRAWYVGLKQRGIETEMVIYPRKEHSLIERPHHLDLMRRVLAWFDGHLKER
jgi:dipeptidyl aminopeptidase/acylaminoacyl peptidase